MTDIAGILKILNKQTINPKTGRIESRYNFNMLNKPLKKPELLLILPLSIARDVMNPTQEIYQYSDPLRYELDLFVREHGSFLDKTTVIPVNAKLDKLNIKLTKEALQAIKDDILHTKGIDSRPDKIRGRHEQADFQIKIAKEFTASKEIEGAILHTIFAGILKFSAGLHEAIAHTTITERLRSGL